MASTEGDSVVTHNSIALVDLSYLFGKSWHAYANHSEVNYAAENVLRELSGVRDSVDHVILCCDSPPYWRKEVYADYKGHREKPSDGMLQQMRWLNGRVDADGYQVAKKETFEADDVIATLAPLLSQECEDVRIIGCDKDLAQCVTERVRMFVPAVGEREEEILGPKEVYEKYGVPPMAIVELLALMGDTSDNVPGCKGVGGKGAAKLLEANQWSVEDLLKNLAEDKENGAPLSKKELSVLEQRDSILLSRKLVRLRTDVELEVDELLQRKDPKPLAETEEMEDETDRATEEPTVSCEPTDTGAIVRTNHDWSLSLQPHDHKGAYALSKVLFNSRLYAKFQSPDAIFAVLMRGRELGLGVTTALDNFHVIEGKPAASAHLIMALTQKHPDCEYLMMVESTAERAVYETKHRRQPKAVRMEYTMHEARDAGLVRPRSPWDKFPKAMLRKTCGVLLCRAVYQEATCGLSCPEELGS